MRRPQHTIFVFHRRQRNRSRDIRHGAPCGRYDLRRGLVQDAVIVSLQPDANFFVSYHVFSLTPSGSSGRKDLAARYKPFRSAGLWAGCRAGLPPAIGLQRRRRYSYCTISLMVPAPTVCPPSRMAKRRPFSIATGVISSITSCTLSPGITISVPEGSSATPVTSVVRK